MQANCILYVSSSWQPARLAAVLYLSFMKAENRTAFNMSQLSRGRQPKTSAFPNGVSAMPSFPVMAAGCGKAMAAKNPRLQDTETPRHDSYR